MRLAINHVTHYAFEQPVGHGLQRLHLTPKDTHGQQVLDWSMRLTGAAREADYDDQNHNRTTLISLEPGVKEVTVECSGTVETADNAGVVGRHDGFLPLWVFCGATALTRPGPKLRALAAPFAHTDKGVDTLHALSAAVLDALPYEAGHTTVTTNAEEALGIGHGVCQDHAHVFCAAARSLGVPARYVGGYLMLNDRIEQEAGHAWAEAHLPELGWVGFDISNQISPDSRYVRVASGRDYREAAPVTGIAIGAGATHLEVCLAVEQQTAQQ
ncbi:MAG: transglutaminase family protein [Novosphingobium sp.]|nr:transglutaminase family protein [Novosphingobium sp.]